MKNLDAAFSALADPTSRAILARLAAGEATVMDLAAPFEMTQPAISRHLKVLEGAGLIVRRIEGTKRPCRLAPAALDEIDRWLGMLRQALSQNYDRQEAIEELSKIGSAASARALLKRFDWHLDPSITDQEEKETCLRGIVAAGESALEPLREYCKKAESLTWAIKVLKGTSSTNSPVR